MNLRSLKLVLCLLLAAKVPFHSAAELLDEAKIKQLLVDRIDVQKRSPGIVVGLIDSKGSRIIAYGKMRRDSPNPVNGETVFEIGSITKVFTSLVLSDMVQREELKLEDPVAKYLPQTVKVPERNGKQITLVDLATHTSGLPRLPSNLSLRDLTINADNPYANYTVEQMYDFLSDYSLPRDIGEKYEYSNYGTGLLGHLLALKAGTNYEALVVRRICLPLGMTNTHITLSPGLKQRLATGHNTQGKPVSNWDIPTLAGAGALRSTVSDMLKFLAANLGLVQSPLHKAMDLQQQPRHRTGSSGLQIGLAWHISRNAGKEMIWHNGGTGGYHSFAGFIKASRQGVVVLSNSAGDIDDLGQFALGFRTIPQEVHINLDLYDQYLGDYDFGKLGTFKVTRKGGHLFGQLTGQGALELFPDSETNFFFNAVDARLTFNRNTNKAVTGLVLHQGGAVIEAPKIR